MANFLAKIKLVLEKMGVDSGLDTTQGKLTKISKTKISATYDKQGLATGAKAIQEFSDGTQRVITFNKSAEVTGSKLSQTFDATGKSAKHASVGLADFGNALRRAAIVAPVWMVLRSAMMAVIQLVGEQIKFLKDLDLAMARIEVVGKGTREEYGRLKDSLVSLSVTYGTVASAALDAAVIFTQQGRTVDETIKLTRAAMIASAVLGSDMKTTVNNLTAAIESFNIPIENSISIIDKWINVSKNFAVTAQDLADATKAAGATASQLGISINAFLGDVSAVIEVTRKSGSEAARGLQFIYARLLTTGAKAITQVAKIPIYLDEHKKATSAITRTYRSQTDVLDELASKWDALENTERLAIAQSVASKRQLTIFMALMQNYTASLNARIIALSAAGQAEKAFGVIQETITIKTQRLAASWNYLTTAVADTSAWKGTLDVLSEVITVLGDIANEQQRLKSEGIKTTDVSTKEFDTLKARIESLKELIQLRNEYLTRPPTDRNLEMLDKINKAIESVSKGKVIINVDTENALEKLNELAEYVAKQQIEQEVKIKFVTDKKVLEQQIKELTKFPTPGAGGLVTFLAIAGYFLTIFKRQKQVANIQQKINGLTQEQNTELEKGLANYDIENAKIQQTLEFRRAMANLEDELLEEDYEKLRIAEKLSVARKSGVLTNQQLLDLEIALVEQALFGYGIYERRLKLAELESQRTSAIVADSQKQIDLVSSILKISGEQESSIIRQEMALKAMLHGEDYINNSMKDRLRLAQALTEESENQEKSSSRLVELFKVARSFGMGVAREVSKFLAGALDFRRLSAEAQEALRRLIPGEFERGMATEFFRGRAFEFPEQITAEAQKARAVSILQNVMVEPIQLNVNIDSEDLIQRLKQEISNELDKVKSQLSQKINQKIENF